MSIEEELAALSAEDLMALFDEQMQAEYVRAIPLAHEIVDLAKRQGIPHQTLVMACLANAVLNARENGLDLDAFSQMTRVLWERLTHRPVGEPS